MKLTQLTIYWDADDDYAVIVFLDELRQILIATYGDDIVQSQRALSQSLADQQQQFDFGDEIDF